jgi:glyoxylate reductase
VTIAATQTFPGPAWDELPDLTLLESWPPAEPLPGVEVLVEAVVAVGPEQLDRLPDLRLVANYGVGYDRVDVAACRERGVAVTNTPGVLDAAVADLTLGLILACRRHLVASDRFVREGRWRRGWARPELLGRDLEGATLGLVGFGRIGRQVASRARAFGMRIVFHRQTGGLPLDELLRTADVVSLHVPLTPETDGLVSRERLALLQDGATLINTARGAIVDEAALVRALRARRIAGAGLDVFEHEPKVDLALRRMPNVVLAPHLGSATVEVREEMANIVVDNILAFLAGKTPPNCVNPEVLAAK